MGSAFRISSQSKLRAKLPAKSCAVIFSGGFQAFDPTRQFPRPFSCDPDFFYLTGYRIPDAVVVVFSEARALTEGNVSTLLFLPDKTDYGLTSMGYEYRGKFGMAEEGIAIRPAAQWKKFCNEVLAAEGMERIFSKPIRESDFRKPGDRDYNYMGAKLFSALSPGFAFDPQAQRYYKEILAIDSATMPGLVQRVNAMLEYEMPEQKDPILLRFLKVQNSASLQRLQADIRSMKIDLLAASNWMMALRLAKSEKEIALLKKAAGMVMDAIQTAATRAQPGKKEVSIQAVAEYILHHRGGRLAMPAVVASGKHSAQPNYTSNLAVLPKAGPVVLDFATVVEGYHARATRTVPVAGDFGVELRPLYEGVVAIHRKSMRACIPGAMPSKLQAAAATGFDELDKRLIFSINALGARKVLKVTHIAPIGLELEEGDAPQSFGTDQVIVVETAIYLPDEDGVTAKWRGTGIVLRDMVRITDAGNEVLTETLPLDALAVEAMVKSTFNLPED